MPRMQKSKTINNKNYFLPLQTLEENEAETEAEPVVSKVIIPPLTIFKQNVTFIHTQMKTLKITDYYIKTISIGIKLFLKSSESFIKTRDHLLNTNCEFFTHDTKQTQPYKAVLSGIEFDSSVDVKIYLISLGLKCTDVKTVEKTTRYGLSIKLFVVYFENRSITLNELKQKYCYLHHHKVRWEHKTKPVNKLTQCYNCQLYGHGSKFCHIKTSCAHCAGPHNTSECLNKDVNKCANCKGEHKSNDAACPCRQTYSSIFNRRNTKSQANGQGFSTRRNTDVNFPQLPTRPNVQPNETHNLRWSNLFKTPEANINNINTNYSNNLFSFQEISALIKDVVSKLSHCKNKVDQFNVITELSIKYLYADHV